MKKSPDQKPQFLMAALSQYDMNKNGALKVDSLKFVESENWGMKKTRNQDNFAKVLHHSETSKTFNELHFELCIDKSSSSWVANFFFALGGYIAFPFTQNLVFLGVVFQKILQNLYYKICIYRECRWPNFKITIATVTRLSHH